MGPIDRRTRGLRLNGNFAGPGMRMSFGPSSPQFQSIRISNWCFRLAMSSIPSRSVLCRKNAIVVSNAPQLELLKKASICVTHAGFNTVLEALTQGVPQIAIPITNDQFGIAARIADKQTGTVASLEGLDPSRLSGHFDEVLNNPVIAETRARCKKLSRERTDFQSRRTCWKKPLE